MISDKPIDAGDTDSLRLISTIVTVKSWTSGSTGWGPQLEITGTIH